jgi:hypothetical protein
MQKWKVFLLFLTLLAGSVTSSSAQRFKASLLGGFNLAQLDGDDLSGFNKIGINGGAKVAAVLSERWQLSLEMLYSQQGSHRSRDDLFFGIYDDIRLNFVETPVMVSFKDWKFRVSTGFSYARLINFKATSVIGEDLTDTETYRDDLYFWIIGATYYFEERWGVNVRWQRALVDLEQQVGKTLLGRNLAIRLVFAL